MGTGGRSWRVVRIPRPEDCLGSTGPEMLEPGGAGFQPSHPAPLAHAGEGIIEWAARVGAKFVGTYTLGSLRMVYAEHDNDDVTTFNPHTVEPFASREEAAERGFSKMV